MKKEKKINTRAKGSYFEKSVQKYLEDKGYYVIRQSCSVFPDLIAITPSGKVKMVECKVAKYLNKAEKREFERILMIFDVTCYVAYPKYSAYSSKHDNIVIKQFE